MKGIPSKYFRLIPTKLEFNKPVSAYGKQKDLLLTVSFKFPAAYDVEGKTPGATVSTTLPLYENLIAPVAIQGGSSSSAGWVLVPGTTPGRTLAGAQHVDPVNITIIAKETEKGKGAAILLKVQQAIADTRKDLYAVKTAFRRPAMAVRSQSQRPESAILQSLPPFNRNRSWK